MSNRSSLEDAAVVVVVPEDIELYIFRLTYKKEC